MQQIAENLWLLGYPLTLLGMQIGRNVSVIRLANGKLIIHSTAPFSAPDIAAIRQLGEPAWIVEATRFHDSKAAEGRAAFPDVTYLVPAPFSNRDRLGAAVLSGAPDEWAGEVELRRIDGMPSVQEHATFHRSSRTLIVGDLLFNFPADASWWTKLIARWVLRLDRLVGMSLVFRSMIKDRQAFHRSMADIFAWDFDRVIVGHGSVAESGGKELLRKVVETVA
ncbi:MAG TPA: hypothetical protein VK993_09755 [Chthoniobacterales bacterium]|nr:hypothetical protein [Chthoniobacterales bacterium]